MKISTSTDPRGIGILALQHKDYDKATGNPLGKWDLHHRASILAARVLDRNDTELVGLGHWIYDPETVGDVHGAQLLKYDTRSIPMWRFATPAVVVTPDNAGTPTPSSFSADTCAVLSGFSVNSIENDKYQADERLKKFSPFRPKRNDKDVWPKFAVDTFGISLVANKESDQVDLFFPTDPRLIAVNLKGDAQMGSFVVDMGDDFKTDLERYARLQSMIRVVKEPIQCHDGKWPLNVIAWNIGPSGCGDTRGGYVFEKRSNSPSTPTPGGGTGAPVATGNQPINFEGRDTTTEFFSVPGGGVFENPNFQREGMPGGGGGRAGAGAGGIGPPPPIVGAAPSSTSGKGIIALISQFDSGHSDVGSETDKHVLGKDADGHPINPLHVHTNAYFRRDDFYDAPIEFGSVYIPPERGRYLMPTYLRYDPKPLHPHVCGPKPGLWRLESECCLRIPDVPFLPPPPPPPPPVATGASGGGGGGGGPPNTPSGTPRYTQVPTITLRQWYPGKFDSYAAMEMLFSVPAMIGRPQSLKTNTIDLRQAKGFVPPVVQDQSDKTTPAVYRLESYGKQTAGEWGYTSNPGKGRYAGGTAPGGLAFMPPEFDITDNVDSFSRNASVVPSVSPAYFVMVPGAYYGAGIPVPSTGGIKTGYRWGVNVAGDLTFSRLSSTGVVTDVVILEADGTVALPADTTVKMGTGTGTVKVKGLADSNGSPIGNVGAGEDDLRAYTLPADSFGSSLGRVFAYHAAGTAANNANAKTLRFRIAGTQAFSHAFAVNAAHSWVFDAKVVFSSLGNVTVSCMLISTIPSASPEVDIQHASGALAFSLANEFKLTAEATSDNDIIQNYMETEFYN